MKSPLMRVGASLVFAVGLVTGTFAQRAPASRDFEAEYRAAVQSAKDAAEFEFLGTLARTCLLPQSGGENTADNVPTFVSNPASAPKRDTWYAEPAKVFDNLYFVGGKVHSSWALTTSDGIILIDTIFPYNSEELIVGGMKKLGLDPKNIKYLLISHAHTDHIGGAEMLQARYHPRVVMGGPDWDAVEKYPNRYKTMAPKRDIVATDGMKITLGGSTVTIWLTPGHTPGTLSYTFTVFDRGRPVNVAYSGGTAFNFVNNTPDPGIRNFQIYIDSQKKMAEKAAAVNATVLLSNHSEFDNAYNKSRMLAGRGNGPHPYAIGADWVQRYFKVMQGCARAAQIKLEQRQAGQAEGAGPSTAANNPLVGAWRVAEVADANAAPITNPQPGLYIFTIDHYSFARIQGTRPLPDYPSNDKATDADKVAVFNALYLNTGTYTVTGNTLATKATVAKSAFAIGGAGNQYEFAVTGNTLVLTQRPSGAVIKLVRADKESGAAAGDANAAPNPYREDVGWAKLAPGRKWGAAVGVDIDRDGKSVWVFDRCATADDCSASSLAPIQKFDATGRLVTSFGAGMFNYPHGLFIDRDDNVWVSDGRAKNGKGHTVMKFSPEGKLLMTLGKPGVAGDGPDTFNAPSDILIAPNGDIFVADGHGGDTNARIVKLSKDGKFIKAWGKKGSGPGEFDAPHGLAMDSTGRLFVADRSNSRIQVFDQDGKFLAEWRQFGRPSGVFIDKKDVIYVADSTSTDQINPGYKQGIRIGSVKDGKVTAFIPWTETNTLEGVAADDQGNVYGGFTNTLNFRRFVKR